MSESFAGKVVIVTGAGRGIGRSIAEAFAAAGAHVVLGTRTLSYAEQALAAIEASGGTASIFQLDVNERERVRALVEETVMHHGGIDVIVHSAADIPHGTLFDISDEAIELGISSIVKASFWLTRAAAPHLRNSRDGGRLIFVTSVCGPRTMIPGRIAYGVAKAGLEAFIRGAALELADDNITVNGIEPGLISSDRARGMAGIERLNAFATRIPVPRPGTPQEVAHVALFLASKHSGYITGTSILIDGGSTLSTTDVSSLLGNHPRE